MNSDTVFSTKLKELRKGRKMSQYELSDATNISRVTITRYENGTRMPTMDNLTTLASFFGVTVDDLAGIDTTIKDSPIGSLTEEEQELIRLYRDCSDRERAKVVAYADGILSKHK